MFFMNMYDHYTGTDVSYQKSNLTSNRPMSTIHENTFKFKIGCKQNINEDLSDFEFQYNIDGSMCILCWVHTNETENFQSKIRGHISVPIIKYSVSALLCTQYSVLYLHYKLHGAALFLSSPYCINM